MNISKYEKQGFVGCDIDLRTSLLEYGLIWKEFKYDLKSRGIKKGEILAISCCPNIHEPDETTKYGYFTKEGLLNESWVNWNDLAKFEGITVDKIKEQDTGNLLLSLVNYHGACNFFG